MQDIIKKSIWKIYAVQKCYSIISVLNINLQIKRNKNTIFVFGAPNHSNMGDQAQTYCIEQLIKKNYPDYQIIISTTDKLYNCNYYVLRHIRKNIRINDKIFLHSGYHTTDLYPMEDLVQQKVIQLFPDKKIIIFPQTVNYISDEEKEKASQVYDSENVIFLARDKVSYQNILNMVSKPRVFVFPDVVTTMIGQFTYSVMREGILLCMRNDKESLYDKICISAWKEKLCKYGDVSITDTTISVPAKKIRKNRKKCLEEIWKKYANYKLIITDRYHGIIFSLIAGTPVIVLPSADHKLVSGVDWFVDVFHGYVRYVEDISQLENIVEEMLACKYDYCLTKYFCSNYYDHLKSIIETN